MTTLAWVIGGSGLLGQAVRSEIHRRPGWTLAPHPPLPWGESNAVAHAAHAIASMVFEQARTQCQRWAVIWVAGAAVTSTPQSELDAELAQLSAALEAIADSARLAGTEASGALFYASSAGGIYGGSESPPFDERTIPVPISPYGEFKLQAEALIREFSATSGVATVCGRIANIYGPGQKLTKMQGVISHLAKAQLSPRPASIFVPLDTVRDYIYVSDCAEYVLDVVDRLQSEISGGGRPARVKNIASGQAVSIGTLLGLFSALSKGRPNVMIGSSPEASLQSLDLRLRSVVWPDLDNRDVTPLAAGIKSTIDDVLSSIQDPCAGRTLRVAGPGSAEAGMR